jgi:formate dehydrogenase beta subunit
VSTRLSDMTPRLDPGHDLGTGPVRTRRPVYVDLMPPCNNACPAGENIQGWLALAQAGGIARPGAPAGRRQPDAPPCMAGSATTPAKPPATGPRSTAPSASTPSSASSATWPSSTGWAFRSVAPPSGRRSWSSAPGPRAVGRLPPGAAGTRVEIHEAGPRPGGMMHFGIPAYRLPRADPDARDRPDRGNLGVSHRPITRSRTSPPRSATGRLRRRLRRHRRGVGKHVDIPARDAAKVLDAVSSSCTTPAPGAATAARPPGGGLRRRQHRDGCGPHRPPARAPRRHDRLPPRPRPHAGPRLRGRRGAEEEGVKINWLRTIKLDRHRPHRRGHGARRAGQPAADRAVRDPGGRHPDPGAGPGDRHRLPRRHPGIGSSRRARCRWAGHDDRGAGHLRRRRHGAEPADRDHRPSATASGGAPYRCLAARRRRASRRPSTPSPTDQLLHLWYFTDARPREQPQLTRRPSAHRLRRGAGRAGEGEAVFEARRCYSCGNCFECDGCYGACPEQAIIKLGPGCATRSTTTGAPAAVPATSSAPATPSR